MFICGKIDLAFIRAHARERCNHDRKKPSVKGLDLKKITTGVDGKSRGKSHACKKARYHCIQRHGK